VERSLSSRWRFMNPVEWLKTIYGWLGASHPKISLVAVVILSAVLGGAVWKFAGYLYSKDHTASEAAQPASTVNTTTGSQSPILTNNSGNVTITNDAPKSKVSAPKDKPK
jgi:hypothetical protein